MDSMPNVEVLLPEQVAELAGSVTEVIGVFDDASCDETNALKGNDIAMSIDAMRAAGDKPGKLCVTSWQRIEWHPILRRVLLVGLGDTGEFDTGKVRRAAAAATKAAKGSQSLVLAIDSSWLTAAPIENVCEAVVEGFLLALDGPGRNKENGNPQRLVIQVKSNTLISNARSGVNTGLEIAMGVILARRVADAPASEMTPYRLAEFCRDEFSKAGVVVSVMLDKDLDPKKFAGLIAVGHGSANPPSFTTLEYSPNCEAKGTVVLIGKGITFDSGGLSLKDKTHIQKMKYDKGGAASVLGAIYAAANLALPVHIIALIPAAENLPSSTAFRPGDVLSMANGKSVEIISTDGEGRLILADALLYAKRFQSDFVIDVATLTGGCRTALGAMASGLFSNTPALLAELQTAGETEDEWLWPLPLFPQLVKQLSSEVADLKNSTGPIASGSTAAAFLQEFVNYPWAHIDIAGTAWDNNTSEYCPNKGATGVGVRSLVRLLRMRSQ